MPYAEHHLRYVSAETAPRPLPAWACAMTRIGSSLAQIDPGHRRIVVGVTVPARGFAAALAAAALVLRRNQLDPVEPDDAEIHFELLRAQPPGTPVKLLQGGRLHDGRLRGVEERDGAELLAVSTRKMMRYLPKAVALNVRISDSAVIAGSDMRSRRIDVRPLLAGFLAGQAAGAYATQSRLDCILAGTVTQLVADLTTAEFTTDGSAHEPGCLQDLARANGAPGAASSSRSALVAAGVSEDELPPETPHAVIFDGGRAYTRLGHAWEESHHLVIIDRSQAAADGAAEALNLAYFERVSDAGLEGIECPPSMEITSFEVMSR